MTQPQTESALQPALRTIEALPASRSDARLTGFEHRFETVNGVRLHYVSGGRTDGDTVVLLAGFPESWYAWRKVMPLLAERYKIVALDLPGQGDSDRPAHGYDTQSLAGMVHGLLQQLGISEYFLAAHDVGAWVAYPYAALFGNEVRRLALLDAGIPGITLPDALPIAPERAWRTWHFAFHAIPDLPEMLIAGREREYLDWFLRRKTANPESFSDADVDEYLRVFKKDGGLRAGLAYYRAAALSAQQNRALCAKGKLKMPVLALGSDQGSIPDMAAPLRAFAEDVHGGTIAFCGHFLPEEQPAAVAAELTAFFS
ncbi:alpha/beta fold hydrolase [Caballeronia sp. LjRoot31]|uniref:alpha/beta fold hydrolase n=1 Tax=Caballeronia sp. LjRoot31 TaxID=3342324 RepID=UPI003ED16BAD